MLDTKKIVRKVLEKSTDKESELVDELNLLEEKESSNNYYDTVKDSNIKNLKSLMDYYMGLNSEIDRLNFYRFVLYVLDSEEETEKFLQELKNISLLNSTGLYKYAHEQEDYSKMIINNFLNKLNNLNSSDNNVIKEEIQSIMNKLDLIDNYKKYLSPVGIVKEVDNPNEYYDYLKVINLSSQDKTKALLMALSFNTLYHDNELSNYEEDDDLKDIEISNIEIITQPATENATENKEEIEDLVIEEIKEEPVLEEVLDIDTSENIDTIEDNNAIENKEEIEVEELDYDQEKVNNANKIIKDNINNDPYDLFVKYYDALLGTNDYKQDKKIIDKAKKYLDKHIQSINNLSDIVEKDLLDTLNVYKENEDLRYEVYKTTSNIERLCAYEINDIFNSIDINDNENINLLVNKLKPVIEYIDNSLTKKKK